MLVVEVCVAVVGCVVGLLVVSVGFCVDVTVVCRVSVSKTVVVLLLTSETVDVIAKEEVCSFVEFCVEELSEFVSFEKLSELLFSECSTVPVSSVIDEYSVVCSAVFSI